MSNVLSHFEVPDSDVSELEDMLADPRLSSRVHIRVRVVLLRADLLTPTAISDSIGMSRQSVHKWIQRYRDYGIIGLQEHRKGKGQIGRRISRKSLRGEADRLLKRNKALSWIDLEQLCLTHLRSIQDDGDGSVYASHSKAKGEVLKTLNDIMKAQRADDSTAEDFLDELNG